MKQEEEEMVDANDTCSIEYPRPFRRAQDPDPHPSNSNPQTALITASCTTSLYGEQGTRNKGEALALGTPGWPRLITSRHGLRSFCTIAEADIIALLLIDMP